MTDEPDPQTGCWSSCAATRHSPCSLATRTLPWRWAAAQSSSIRCSSASACKGPVAQCLFTLPRRERRLLLAGCATPEARLCRSPLAAATSSTAKPAAGTPTGGGLQHCPVQAAPTTRPPLPARRLQPRLCGSRRRRRWTVRFPRLRSRPPRVQRRPRRRRRERMGSSPFPSSMPSGWRACFRLIRSGFRTCPPSWCEQTPACHSPPPTRLLADIAPRGRNWH